MRWPVTDAESAVRLYAHLGNFPMPYTVTVKPGEPRSLDQNALFHVWMGEIARHRGDTTAARVKAEYHIEFGIPLLRSDPDYSAFIGKALGGLRYDEVANLIERGFVPCTSLMTVPQMRQYLDHVQQQEAAKGIALTDPERSAA